MCNVRARARYARVHVHVIFEPHSSVNLAQPVWINQLILFELWMDVAAVAAAAIHRHSSFYLYLTVHAVSLIARLFLFLVWNNRETEKERERAGD